MGWGDFRRFTPISSLGGRDRGSPIEDALVEEFLESRKDDVRGAVLDLRGQSAAAGSLWDPRERRPLEHQPSAAYDCVILSHILQHALDPEAAVADSRRMLKPGGVLLATVPTLGGSNPIFGPDTDFWRLSEEGLRSLLVREFDPANVEVVPRGTQAAAIALLAGLALEDVPAFDLAAQPNALPLLVTGRAVAPTEDQATQ